MRKIAIFLSFLLIFSIPWEDSIAVGTVGSISRLIGLVVAASWLFIVVVDHRLRLPHSYHAVLFLFVLWNILSFFWSGNLDWTVQRIETYAQVFLLVYIFWDLYDTHQYLKYALQAYVLGAYVAVIATIINFLNGQEAYLYSGGRYSVAGVNAVDLAVILSLGLPLAWYLATTKEGINRPFKILNFAYMPLAIFAIFLTGSRTALFTILPTMLYVLWSVKQFNPSTRLIISSALALSLVLLWTFFPTSTFARLSTVFSSVSSGDFGRRGGLWLASLRVFSDYPFLGVGSGSLRTYIGEVAHNSFLSVLAELGIVGLALFCLVLLVVFYQIFIQPNKIRALWITVFTIWLFGISSLTWEFRKPSWIFLSFIVVGAGLVSRNLRDANRPPMASNNLATDS